MFTNTCKTIYINKNKCIKLNINKRNQSTFISENKYINTVGFKMKVTRHKKFQHWPACQKFLIFHWK